MVILQKGMYRYFVMTSLKVQCSVVNFLFFFVDHFFPSWIRIQQLKNQCGFMRLRIHNSAPMCPFFGGLYRDPMIYCTVYPLGVVLSIGSIDEKNCIYKFFNFSPWTES